MGDKTRLDSGIRPDQLEVGNPYYTIQSVIDKHIISALEKSISIQRPIDKDLPPVNNYWNENNIKCGLILLAWTMFIEIGEI